MIKNKEELYKEVLSLFIKEGWKRGNDMDWAKGPPYTLVTAFWRVRHDCGVTESVWDETFDHMQTLIKTQYPNRIKSKLDKNMSYFGKHKDTTYEEVVEILELALGENLQPKKIKFREWF